MGRYISVSYTHLDVYKRQVLNVKTLMDIDIPAIEKIYDDAGYIAYITEEVGIDPNTGVLSLPILEVRIEDIKITGNKKTKTYVIMREMQMKKGDVFNRNILFSDIRRIYDLELFDRENAEPYKLAPGTDLSKIIITSVSYTHLDVYKRQKYGPSSLS